jgi:hypothetical protein
MGHTADLKQLFLNAPESQLDPSLRPLIEKWTDPCATSLEVLEVLDQVVHCGAGSGFVVMALTTMYDGLVAEEGTTHEENIARATWRY